MSMTREEAARTLEMMAIDIREELAALNIEIPMAGLFRKRLEAVNIAQEALCPVSREQVENVWRGEWEFYDGGCTCKLCGAESYFDEDFCPGCGRAMNSEAVQMVMERLEAMKDADD